MSYDAFRIRLGYIFLFYFPKDFFVCKSVQAVQTEYSVQLKERPKNNNNNNNNAVCIRLQSTIKVCRDRL